MMKCGRGSFTLGLVLAAAVNSFAVPVAHARERLVLITGFKPYDGDPFNLAENVALEVATSKNTNGLSDVKIETCIIPVEYDQSIRRAQACIERLERKPDLVISLGEATLSVQLELSGANEDRYSKADEAGEKRTGVIIDSQGPEKIYTTLPIQQFTPERLQLKKGGLFMSTNAGGFVCNHTAYLLGAYLRKMQIPYGFIHVPSYYFLPDDEKADLTAGHIPSTVHESSSLVAKIVKSTLEYYSSGRREKKLKKSAKNAKLRDEELRRKYAEEAAARALNGG